MHHYSQRFLGLARAAALAGLMASPCSLLADSANVTSIKKELERFRAAAKNDLPKDARKRARVIETFEAYDKKLKNIESELMAKVEENAAHPKPELEQEGRAQMARLVEKAPGGEREQRPEASAPTSTEVMKIASAVDSVITGPRMEEVKARVAKLEEQNVSTREALADLRKSTSALTKEIAQSRAEQKQLASRLGEPLAKERFDELEAHIAKQAQASVTLGRAIEALAGQIKVQEGRAMSVPAPEISGRIASLEAAQKEMRDETARQAKSLSKLEASNLDLAGSQARIEAMLAKLVESRAPAALDEKPVEKKPVEAAPAASPPEQQPRAEQAAQQAVPSEPAAPNAADSSASATAKLPPPPIRLSPREAETSARVNDAPVVERGGIKEKVIVGEVEEDPRARAAMDVAKTISDPERAKDVEEFNDWEEIDFAPVDDPSEMRIAAILPEKARLLSEADTESEVIAVVPRGSRLLVEMRRGPWYRVIAPNGRHSWIQGNLLGFGYDEDPESALLIKGVDEKLLEGS